MNKEKKPERNQLETIRNIISILAGLLTILYRIYQFLKG